MISSTFKERDIIWCPCLVSHASLSKRHGFGYRGDGRNAYIVECYDFEHNMLDSPEEEKFHAYLHFFQIHEVCIIVSYLSTLV